MVPTLTISSSFYSVLEKLRLYVTRSSKLYLFIVLLHISPLFKNASSFLLGRKSSDLLRQQRSEFEIAGQGSLTRLVADAEFMKGVAVVGRCQ